MNNHINCSNGQYFTPGQIVLFGSGETSHSGRRIFEEIFRALPVRPRISLLETPAGFELNSREVIARIADFLSDKLQNYQPQIEILPARKRGTIFSPDNPEIVSPILTADLIFMGPGSPTYAIRQLRGSLAWEYILVRNTLGASLVLASSAVVAIGSFALPVYEIYKVGVDLHWNPGLDLFNGSNMVFFPHWNNKDGGSELDTSCCFMGKTRFAQLLELLPPNATIVGIDEHTALLFDFHNSICRVYGRGSVTVIQPKVSKGTRESEHLDETIETIIQARKNSVHSFESNQTVPMNSILALDYSKIRREFPVSVWQRALDAKRELDLTRINAFSSQPAFHDISELPNEIVLLLGEREQARKKEDWQTSDKIRSKIKDLGWEVLDTPEGQKASPSKQPPD
jgi:hypothetical protein